MQCVFCEGEVEERMVTFSHEEDVLEYWRKIRTVLHPALKKGLP